MRVVLVGDSRCGKTTLLSRFTTDSVPAQYAPTSFDKVTVVKAVGGRTVRFTVWDTSGAHSFDTVRPLSYGEADIFVICCRVRLAIIRDNNKTLHRDQTLVGRR